MLTARACGVEEAASIRVSRGSRVHLIGASVVYRYKPEVLQLLARHGVVPRPTTPPTTARAVVNDIYRYELRLLRDRYLVGEFSKEAYYDKVVEIRNRYPVMAILTRFWTY
jgi:hypothetical protein